ncbi:Nodulin-like domain-containing protein/MFS_1 domain-containing protein [Cephalotus follicularis]|uniref:Nodulin-like domain-containing protein/MFS_1 domain-containing protein n=1 Tax=Cephalotus follicularis TaxID=3775 RepID=A0A1Q3AZ98_CEPFO|nr:Nodulin-like domain-containing protein/MFS_1 domain-containing protein [Cephalotus follicularis]
MPRQVLKQGSRPPWVGLAAAVWVQISAGNAYNFPLYSPALKSVLGFNQQQVTILGVANDIGENVGLLPGIACNKFPPWAVLLVGVVSCFLGYGVLWLAVSQTVQVLPYWLLWLALVVATNSNAWFGTAVLVTNMRNFPLSRGTVAGILKGYVGISAAVYTVIYSLVLGESASKLLLCLTLGIPVLILAMMYLIRPCAPPSGEDSSTHIHFVFTQATSVLLGIYLVAITVIYELVSFSDAIVYVLVTIMVLLLLSPLGIPVKMTLFPEPKNLGPPVWSSDSLSQGEGESTLTEPLLTPSSSATFLGRLHDSDASDVETLLAMGEGAVTKKRRPKRGEDFKLREALVKADFWLLWVVYFLGVGSGVTVLNNLAQIGVAFGVDDATILLCLFSFCNFLGRLGSGAVSEHFVRSHIIPRTLWIMCSLIIMAFAFILYALALDGTLYVSTCLIGVCYGVQYATMVPTVSELFGLKHFGIMYNFMLLGNPIGALLFSGLLAGYVYDAEAAKQGSSSCVGADCFRLTFLVLAGICGLGTIFSIILTIRIRPVYEMLYSGGSFRLPQSLGH